MKRARLRALPRPAHGIPGELIEATVVHAVACCIARDASETVKCAISCGLNVLSSKSAGTGAVHICVLYSDLHDFYCISGMHARTAVCLLQVQASPSQARGCWPSGRPYQEPKSTRLMVPASSL